MSKYDEDKKPEIIKKSSERKEKERLNIFNEMVECLNKLENDDERAKVFKAVREFYGIYI